MEILSKLPWEDEIDQQEADEKELAKERKRYDKLLDKRSKMLFCAGVTREARLTNELAFNRAKDRLEKTKAWRGNEFEIECCREHIRYLEIEIADLERSIAEQNAKRMAEVDAERARLGLPPCKWKWA